MTNYRYENDKSVCYFVQRKKDDLIKIGTTAVFKERFAALRYDYGEIELLGVMTGSYVKEAEIHALFEKHRYYNRGKASEWFDPAPEIFEFIAANTIPAPPKEPRLRATNLPLNDMWETAQELKSHLGSQSDQLVLNLIAMRRPFLPRIKAKHVAKVNEARLQRELQEWLGTPVIYFASDVDVLNRAA